VSYEKVCEGPFHIRKKEARANEVSKTVERNPACSWLLVDNSNYLIGDVWIMYGDSELRQINHRVHSLICILVFLLFDLLE
jgi:hypothetical protein